MKEKEIDANSKKDLREDITHTRVRNTHQVVIDDLEELMSLIR